MFGGAANAPRSAALTVGETSGSSRSCRLPYRRLPRGTSRQELSTVLAEGGVALERRLAGALEQALDAAEGLNLAEQESRGGNGVAHGAVRHVGCRVRSDPAGRGVPGCRATGRPARGAW